MNKGFTLIEIIVSIAIISILSAITLFSVSQYISIGKDSNIAGNLSSLIPAGEVFYGGNDNNYAGFCNPQSNSVLRNAISQMPQNLAGYCYNGVNDPTVWKTESNESGMGNYAGVCCSVNTLGNAWVAYARLFVGSDDLYCVDSRAVRKSLYCDNLTCTNDNIAIIERDFKCP